MPSVAARLCATRFWSFMREFSPTCQSRHLLYVDRAVIINIAGDHVAFYRWAVRHSATEGSVLIPHQGHGRAAA